MTDEQVAAYGRFTGELPAAEESGSSISTPSLRTCARETSRSATRDVARLSPLGHAHLNCLGRYAFTTRAQDGLRPLHEPNARDDVDDAP